MLVKLHGSLEPSHIVTLCELLGEISRLYLEFCLSYLGKQRDLICAASREFTILKERVVFHQASHCLTCRFE